MRGEEYCLFIVYNGCKNKQQVQGSAKLAPIVQRIAPLSPSLYPCTFLAHMFELPSQMEE
jgi:hypothetical protein